MARYHNDVSQRDLVGSTRALLMFCRSHDRASGLDNIENCLKALEQDDFNSAYQWYKRVPLGGMGCFNDWFPPPMLPGEDGEYVSTVFDALCERWSRLMKMAAGELEVVTHAPAGRRRQSPLTQLLAVVLWIACFVVPLLGVDLLIRAHPGSPTAYVTVASLQILLIVSLWWTAMGRRR
jgi:hypothetical protein